MKRADFLRAIPALAALPFVGRLFAPDPVRVARDAEWREFFEESVAAAYRMSTVREMETMREGTGWTINERNRLRASGQPGPYAIKMPREYAALLDYSYSGFDVTFRERLLAIEDVGSVA